MPSSLGPGISMVIDRRRQPGRLPFMSQAVAITCS
jgi:hypothetical protein